MFLQKNQKKTKNIHINLITKLLSYVCHQTMHLAFFFIAFYKQSCCDNYTSTTVFTVCNLNWGTNVWCSEPCMVSITLHKSANSVKLSVCGEWPDPLTWLHDPWFGPQVRQVNISFPTIYDGVWVLTSSFCCSSISHRHLHIHEHRNTKIHVVFSVMFHVNGMCW